MTYIYPRIPGRHFGLFRIMGSGLANCLFVYARAIAAAHKSGAKLITPTWFNINIGTYLRHQADKRHYLGLFNSKGEVCGLKKLFVLMFLRHKMQVEEGLGNYFRDLLDDTEIISSHIISHIKPKWRKPVEDYDFTGCVAIHIRLGDYTADIRTPLEWYQQKIEEKRAEGFSRFLIFSDGTDEELAELTKLEGVQRAFFGNAIADIYAISRCEYLIGSDSTFSGWGAYLGQVPCTFLRKHFGPVLKDASKEIVESSENRWGL